MPDERSPLAQLLAFLKTTLGWTDTQIDMLLGEIRTRFVTPTLVGANEIFITPLLGDTQNVPPGPTDFRGLFRSAVATSVADIVVRLFAGNSTTPVILTSNIVGGGPVNKGKWTATALLEPNENYFLDVKLTVTSGGSTVEKYHQFAFATGGIETPPPLPPGP